MTIYIIRSGFTINLLGTIHQGGNEVDLSEQEFEAHKHKLEGVDSDVTPIDFGNGNSNNGECCYPAPYLAEITPAKILTGQTAVVSIEGSFFTPDTTVSLSSGSVDSVEFISSNLIQISATASQDVGSFDLTINNGKQTVLEQAIAFFGLPPGLVDLRLGGTEFDNSAIEARSGISWSRTAYGLSLSNLSNWGSWVRFPGADNQWVRNRDLENPPTLNLIYQPSVGMVGYGSRESNPNSSSQWREQEFVAYHTTSLNGFYGNNGTPGNVANFSLSQSIAEDVIVRLEIANFGQPDSTFRLYLINSDRTKEKPANVSTRNFIAQTSQIEDWMGGELLVEEQVPDTMAADAALVMPVLIPTDNGFNLLGFYYD